MHASDFPSPSKVTKKPTMDIIQFYLQGNLTWLNNWLLITSYYVEQYRQEWQEYNNPSEWLNTINSNFPQQNYALWKG